MFKLTQTTGDESTRLTLEGRLDSEFLAELRSIVARAGEPARVTLDLTGLLSLDAEALRTLHALRDAGCRLIGASLYVERLLQEVRS